MTATLDRTAPSGGSAPSESAPASSGSHHRSTALARLRGRWRIALRHGARDAARHRGRTVMVALMILLPVLAGTTISTVVWSQRSTPERVAAQWLGPVMDASFEFVAPGVMQSPDVSSLGWGGDAAPLLLADAEAALRDLLPAGSTAARVLLTDVVVHGPALQLTAPVVQADVTDPALAATWPVAEGTLPGTGEVALSRDVADQLGVGLGDDVPLRLPWFSESTPSDLGTLRISGLLDEPTVQNAGVLLPDDGPLRAPAAVNTSTPPHPMWFVRSGTPIAWDDVLTANETGFSVLSRHVLHHPPADHEVPLLVGQPGSATGDFMSQWGVVIVLIVVALFEAALLVGPAYAVGARRSARTLALVAANGGSPRALRALVLGTAAVIGVLGAAAGVVAGIAVAAVILAFLPDGIGALEVPWHLVAVMAAVGVLLSLGGALVPARGAAKLNVVATLAGRRGEARSRRWPAVAGSVLAVAGYAAAIFGAVSRDFLPVVGGVVVAQVGLLFAVGGIVTLLGRAAGRLSLCWRLALRDAARHRRRTSPAVAAVLVATAGATAGLVYVAADAQHWALNSAPGQGHGIVTVAAGLWQVDGDLDPAEVAAIREIVADVAPQVGELLTVPVLTETHGPGAEVFGLAPLRPEGSAPGWWTSGGGRLPGPIVDDGSLAHLLGFDDAAAVRDLLGRGQVVTRAASLFDDGTVRFALHDWDASPSDDGVIPTVDEVHLPATAIGDPRSMVNHNLPILPPEAAARLTGHGFAVVVGGLISAEPTTLSRAEAQTIQARLDEAIGIDEWGQGVVHVGIGGDGSEHFADSSGLASMLIFGAGALLALAAAWIAAALAATESRPDLATLTAVGATPGTRKRLVAAQAGTIALLGAVVGAASGLALGAAFVLQRRHTWWGIDPTWEVTIPWAQLALFVVGLPALAVAAAWLVTRGRETLTRRLAS